MEMKSLSFIRLRRTDPVLGVYIPLAPISDEAKKHNQNLPGMGGVFNTINLLHSIGNFFVGEFLS